MHSFHILLEALIHAPPRPPGFPFAQERLGDRINQVRATPYLQDMLAEIRAEAERARETLIPELSFSLFRLFETTGDRWAYEQHYFDRRRRLLGLALAGIVLDDETMLAPLEDLLWTICDEYTWALPAHLLHHGEQDRPAHQVVDLFAAETAHALAETLTLLGERLAPQVTARVRAEIERRVFQPLFHDPIPRWWESTPMNWAAVCGSAVGMAALLLEDNRERLAGMIDRVGRALNAFLTGYGDDGGCAEGINYWVYGFGYYVYFAEMLHEFTDGALDLLAGEKLQRIANFPYTISMDRDQFVNFSDGTARMLLPTGLLSRLTARLKLTTVPPLHSIPSLHADHGYRWAHVTRNLFWTDPAILQQPIGAARTYLPDVAWVVDRFSTKRGVIAFAAKGGHNDEPHNHNDLGHFIVHVGGDNLLTDLGAGLYTRDYFGSRRYQHLHTASAGHSVPIIDGHEQCPGREHAAFVRTIKYHENQLNFTLDLTAAYDIAHLVNFTRSFEWFPEDRGARLNLIDTFEFRSKPSMLEEVFISLYQPVVENKTIRWEYSGGAITMTFDPQQFTPEVDVLPNFAHRGEHITVYRLRLIMNTIGCHIRVPVSFYVETQAEQVPHR